MPRSVSGFPEVGVMQSAGLLLALQTATATDLMQLKSSAIRRTIIVIAYYYCYCLPAARCHVVKLLIILLATIAGYLILYHTLVGAVLAN